MVYKEYSVSLMYADRVQARLILKPLCYAKNKFVFSMKFEEDWSLRNVKILIGSRDIPKLLLGLQPTTLKKVVSLKSLFAYVNKL